MLSTKDLSMFKYTQDNRPIDRGHVSRLVASIKSRNMLNYRPIIVDKEFYVVDGQHRLEAARILGVPIYYEVQENNKKDDIIYLNISKTWSQLDFYNYFVKNKYPEYLKLEAFCKKHALPPKLAVFLFLKRTKDLLHDFRCGKFVFEEGDASHSIEKSTQALHILKKHVGTGKIGYDSKKIWKSIHILCSEPIFDMQIWERNVATLSDKIHTKATEEDTLNHFLWVYNYRNQNKIEIGEKDE